MTFNLNISEKLLIEPLPKTTGDVGTREKINQENYMSEIKLIVD